MQINKKGYSKELCLQLTQDFSESGLEIELPRVRYEVGESIRVSACGLEKQVAADVELEVVKFLGGGFAGQVYRCRLTQLQNDGASGISGLQVGRDYAVKIIIPPTRFSRIFRDSIYRIAFQGPFSSQVNYAACRAGLLWQKLIRIAAARHLGSETAVKDAYASFWDPSLNAYGEITEWIEGRMWRLETDAHIKKRFDWSKVDLRDTDSAEFVAKRRFMDSMVKLMHAMGAPEFARQYEWWTMKSQPNAMKRTDLEDCDGPDQGLCAIDFRAGLALLPFLPMSPGDIKLILDGIFKRRTLVQFDRCDLERLEGFISQNRDIFAGHERMIEELKERDPAYRRSLPDITHHGLRLFYDRELRADVRRGLTEGYRAQGLVDCDYASKLEKGGLRFAVFYVLGAIPVLGKLLRKRIGNAAYRLHVRRMFTSWSYINRTMSAWTARSLIDWHRAGRSSEGRTRYLARHPWIFVAERFSLGLLPAFMHKLIIKPQVLAYVVIGFFVYIYRFVSSAEFRENWFLNEIAEGEKAGMLDARERAEIESHVRDPFIVKYLKCLGVHFATLPITQLVAAVIGVFAYIWMLGRGGGHAEAAGAFLLVIAFFQVSPVSPGSICRGAFVVYLMIRERNWRDYLIAAPLSFVKYIGYLAFPLQMTTTYPHLARFMASRWATEATHIIPVFGERGALLEHWVFDLFFNIPQIAGRHIKPILNIWMIIGFILAAMAFSFLDYEIAGWININLALIVLFIMPRMLFLPLLGKAGRKA